MKPNTKKRILSAINTVTQLEDYTSSDCIFSQKYRLSAIAWGYILMQLAADFRFNINDDFIDALEMCTFERLEILLTQYEGTATADAA